MLITALLMTGALLGGDPDGVVTTAPATTVDLGVTAAPEAPSVEGAAQAQAPHNLTTDEQIDRWLASRSVADAPYARDMGDPLDDRRPHGQVSVGVGTGGYRDYGATVTMPIGESGQVTLSYRQTENGYPYGYGYGYGDGYGHGLYGRSRFHDGGGSVFPARRRAVEDDFESRLMEPDLSRFAPDRGPIGAGRR